MGEIYEVKQRMTFWQKCFMWLVVMPVCVALVLAALMLANKLT